MCACATRYLVEEAELFNGSEIKYQANNNVGYTDTEVLTTIGNLYDLVKEIFKNIKLIPVKSLNNFRGTEADKEELYLLAEDIFRYMFDVLDVLSEYESAADKKSVVKKYRNRTNGGHFLFRPVGLKIYFMAMAKFVKGGDGEIDVLFKDFIDATSGADFMMEGELLSDKVWDSDNKKMIPFRADVRNQIISDLLHHADQRL